jgi:predicted O-methyltransferase YrrM
VHQIISYVKFLLKSTNQHGVHSPFVYDLVIKCFYDKTKYPEYLKLKSYRKALLVSKEKLQITDFGTRLNQLIDEEHNVSNITKTSRNKIKDLEFLFRLSKYFQFKNILKLGTSLGTSTQAFILGHPSSKISTIEGRQNRSNFTKQEFQKLDINTLSFINSNFKSTISNLENQTFDCIYFDGDCNIGETLHYFNNFISRTSATSVFIFSAIYCSKEMTEAWEMIIEDERVTVSIDLFHFGLVFFRTEQPKQHFRIRM